MKTITQRFKELNDRLFKVENKLFEISKEIAITKETSNVYWSSVTRRLKEQYEIARFIYADWVNTNLPLLYDANIKSHIKRIKSMTFKPPFQLDYKEFVNNNINIQSKRIITSTAYSDYDIGLDSGAKKLNRLLRFSQQVNITENELNKSITEGFSKNKSIYGVRKKAQEALLKDALDKKYITVVNKNGVPVDYNIKSYAKLVARTKYIQAQADGTVNLAVAYGSDLVQVSSHNTPTPLCQQFEGKIFSISGEDKRFPALIAEPPFHPNCRHSLTVYFAEAQPAETLQKASDFSLGKSEVHPTLKHFKPVSER